MNLFRSTVVIGGFTLGSRVLGFLRDQLQAAFLGAGPVADAFFVAFRFPNLFRRIFGEGAFNAAFVPLYARRLEGEGGGDADLFASNTLSFLVTSLAVLVIASQIAMPWLIYVLAPGYADDPAWRAQAVLLVQITMPYLLFMSLMALLSGVLNARDRFAAAAGAPILLNVVLVAVLLAKPADVDRLALNLAVGVAVSGALQAGVVYWGCRRAGVRLTLRPPKLTPGVKRLIALGVPGAISASVVQVNLVISQMIASLQEGAMSMLYYADRLYQLPLGLVGIAMGVVLLPELSKRLRAGDEDGAHEAMNRAIEIAALFTLPSAVALGVGAHVWIELLFERGAFTATNTALTSQALVGFAVGLPAFVAVKVFAPGFFARENTKTPMRYAIVSAVANVAIGGGLFWLMGFVGLAWGTAAAAWLNTGLLANALRREGLLKLDARTVSRLPRLALASVVMGVAIGVAGPVVAARLDGGYFEDLLGVAVLAALGAVIYLAACLVLGGARPSDFRTALARRG